MGRQTTTTARFGGHPVPSLMDERLDTDLGPVAVTVTSTVELSVEEMAHVLAPLVLPEEIDTIHAEDVRDLITSAVVTCGTRSIGDYVYDGVPKADTDAEFAAHLAACRDLVHRVLNPAPAPARAARELVGVTA